MNNKKVKKFVSCVCALTLLFGAIPMNFIKAEAEDSAVKTTYYDVNEENPLQLHGVSYDETEQIFKRMDLSTAASIAGVSSDVDKGKYKFVKDSYDEDTGKTSYSFTNNVYSHAREAAGGRIRFSTDSSYVSIEATLQNWYLGYAKTMKDGKYGFDVYVDTEEGSTYAGTISVETYPTTDGRSVDKDGLVTVQGKVEFDTAEMRNLTIYFPITIETKSVKVGVATGSTIAEHAIPYEENQKIVFYGSSITQGGAVTKPGNTYVNTVGRNLNMEYHSLGMWGSAKGQLAFAEYIADPNNVDTKNMTAFVFDYDHNNKTVKDLDGSKIPETDPVEWTENEYYPFYETIRAAYPNIPIILVTRPNNHLDVQNAESPDEYSTAGEMKAFIRAAYERAKADSDANIHFVDGESFFNYSTGYLADNVHPNDAGQARMAEVMTAVLERAFAGEKNICVEPQVDCKDEKLNEDFTLEEGETLNWKNNKADLITHNSGVVKVEGNSVFQFSYKRMVGETPTDYIQYNVGILKDCPNLAIEMDATLYKNMNLEKWPYLSIMCRDSGSKGTYETRVELTEAGYKVSIVDNSDYDNDAKPSYSTIIEESEMADLLTKGTEFSYHIRTEMNTVVVGNGTKHMVFTVSVDDKTAIIDFVPENQNCSPTGLRVYMFGGNNQDTTEEEYRAIVDNIKMYKITKSNTLNTAHTLTLVEEIPATTESEGVRAHCACGICGQKYTDAEGLNVATEEDLVIHKCCSLLSEDFTVASGENISDRWAFDTNNTVEGKDAFGVVTDASGNSVYQLAYTRSKSVGIPPTGYISSTTEMLKNVSDYTIELDGSLYKAVDSANVARWSSLGLVIRDSETRGYYDIRFDVKKTGCQIQLFDETGASRVTYNTVIVKDTELVDMYNAGGPFSFRARVEADNYVDDAGNEKIRLSIYVEDSAATEYNNTPVVYDITPSAECSPTSIRLFMHGAIKDNDIDHKATVDNINIYTTEHTWSTVEKIASTNTVAGTKAHNACSKCDKTFLDNNGTYEVTNEDLAYAKLNDIMCQTRPKKNGLTDIRFVAYVDDYTKYQSVTFKITLIESGKSGTYTCKNVYSAVKELDTMRTTDYLYSVDGYFAAFKLLNNTKAQLDEKMKVEVTWTDLQGQTRTSERTIRISEEQP